jgi:carboxyl-terminal processing protease
MSMETPPSSPARFPPGDRATDPVTGDAIPTAPSGGPPAAPGPELPAPPGSAAPGTPGSLGAAPPDSAAPGTPASMGRVRERRPRLILWMTAVLLVLAVAAGGVGTGIVLDRAVLAPAPPTVPAPGAFDLIRQAWVLLHQHYVEASSLDSTGMARAAIRAMTDAVGDPGHTTYLDPQERAQLAESLSGRYAGIGVAVDVRDGVPVIITVFPDTPAARAGLRVGDRITAVDGAPTQGVSLDLVSSRIRGPAGTSVTLTIQRGTGKPFEVRIQRAEITIQPVSWARIPGTTLVDIAVSEFSAGTAQAFRTALQAALATHPTGLVLDLRGNPGGYVDQAVAVASQFLSSGIVYISRDAAGTETPTKVVPGGLAPQIPLVVLVDQGTASAAEIVAGALQDHHRATIVGQRTFGTGTVLSEFDLSDGSALRIGTVEWLTPTGRVIWHAGIEPDVAVALPSGANPIPPDEFALLGARGLSGSRDTQLLRALALLGATSG